MVLLQVVIAVMLEEVDKARAEPVTSSRRLEQRGALQPLLRDLSAGFEGRDDLRRRLRAVFAAVCAAAAAAADVAESGPSERRGGEEGRHLGDTPPPRYDVEQTDLSPARAREHDIGERR